MAVLQPGALARIRDERWRVEHVHAYDSCAIVEAAGASSENRGTSGRFIHPFEHIEPILEDVGTPRVVRPRVLRAVARSAIAAVTPAWPSLRAAVRARIALLAYQLEPALAMTRAAGCRFLLADEVGLGKTIQAGLLVAEVLSRDRDARVLIVTPASLREQWRDELRDRFSIDAEIFDAGGLARISARLPLDVNPWSVPRVVLTSIDFVKRPDVIRSLEPLVWDLVAFDEAHALSGRSDRATAAELIASRGRRVAAITATPHTGDPRAFERLCALGQLHESEPMLLFRRSRADTGVAGSRTVRLLRIRPTAGEQALHRALESYARRVWREAPAASAPAARLAMMVLARRACSSPASLARSVERRIALLANEETHEAFQLALPLDEGMTRDDEVSDAQLSAHGLSDTGVERRVLERVLTLAHRAAADESKIAAIQKILRRTAEPAIVFTEYRDTLDRLASALTCQAAQLHGGLTTAERLREARRFTHGDARLLLATDAASEGLNLHYRCRLVINLEVPWTPLRLEQRTGRVDRLGQTRRVHAIALVGRGTAEESVVASLMRRTREAARDAPFGFEAGASPPGVIRVDLRSAAEGEAARLQTWRSLDARDRSDNARPVVSIVGRSRLIVATRATFLDESGAVLWDTLLGVDAPLTSSPVRDALALALRTSTRHAALLDALTHDLQLETTLLVGREEAILDALQRGSGRLAAPLVQAGLFDQRALRDRDAQRRVIEEAARCALWRIATLRRLGNPVFGESQLVFAIGV